MSIDAAILVLHIVSILRGVCEVSVQSSFILLHVETKLDCIVSRSYLTQGLLDPSLMLKWSCMLQRSMLADMTVVLLGVIMLTVSNGTSEQGWVVMYGISQLVFGFGIGKILCYIQLCQGWTFFTLIGTSGILNISSQLIPNHSACVETHHLPEGLALWPT